MRYCSVFSRGQFSPPWYDRALLCRGAFHHRKVRRSNCLLLGLKPQRLNHKELYQRFSSIDHCTSATLDLLSLPYRPRSTVATNTSAR